jgi:transposase
VSTQERILKKRGSGVLRKQRSKQEGMAMEVVHRHCAGLDVHKRSVVACQIVPAAEGGWQQEVRRFGTLTEELLALADWLRAGAVTHVAMESTGVYWRPIFNILEAEFAVLLVNAQHIKHVPGRKTDVNDAQWIAQLLQHGLLKASFIPEVAQRDLRELTRYRSKLIQARSAEINRVQKVLEDANIKLGSVASNVLGVSGRAMLEQLVAGADDPARLAQLARGRLREKIAGLEKALTGKLRDTHRLLLKLHLEHIDDLNAKIASLNEEIDRLITPFDQTAALERLDTIPGVNRQIAQVILAELGSDMSRFPSAAHAVSWAGLAPGKNESAGKNRSGKTLKGNQVLKAALTQAAQTAGKSKHTYLAAQFRRLAARRGKKRAAIAVAHTILVIAYHLLARGSVYTELGGDYFDQRNQQQVQRQLVQRLERLGFIVTLEPAA